MGTEDLRPGAGVVLLEGRQNLCWNALREQPVRALGMIPVGAQHTRLVLHLNRDDRVPLSVDLFQVAHESSERARIGSDGRFFVGRRGAHGVAALVDHARVLPHILLYPGRRKMHRRVLEAPEPGQDQTQVVLARAGNQAVHHREVELSFRGFDGLPLDRDFHGVDVNVFRQRPGSLQFAGVAAGIVRLDSEDEIGRVVHQELERALLFRQPGHRRRAQTRGRQQTDRDLLFGH